VSTAVDARRPAKTGTRRGWWLVPELAAVVILAVVAVPFLGASGGLRAAVAERAAQIIEQSSPTQQHEHEDVTPAPQQTFCGVDVFGTDPAGATDLSQVRTVYGYFFCAAGSAGLPYNESNRADGPVVVTLLPAPRAQIPQSGAGYADRVRAMMPDQYEDRCFHGLPDGSIAAAVRDRYESALH
jgi:hypothetical protein